MQKGGGHQERVLGEAKGTLIAGLGYKVKWFKWENTFFSYGSNQLFLLVLVVHARHCHRFCFHY